MLVKMMNSLTRSNTLLCCAFRGVLNQTCAIGAVHRVPFRSFYHCRSFAPLLASPASLSQVSHRVCCSESSQGAHLLRPEGQQEDSSTQRHRPAPRFNIDVLVALLRQENAVDLCVIKVPEHIKYTQYLVVVSGVSPRHLRAMAFYAIKVYKFLKKKGDPNVNIEGKDAEDWTCIDFGEIVVHFMLPQTRETYELEKLWTLRGYDEQLRNIPVETLPEDFVLDLETSK